MLDEAEKLYTPSAAFSGAAHADRAKYEEMYAESVADPEAFWAREAQRIDWIKPFTKVKDVDYSFGNVGHFLAILTALAFGCRGTQRQMAKSRCCRCGSCCLFGQLELLSTLLFGKHAFKLIDIVFIGATVIAKVVFVKFAHSLVDV